MPDFGVGIYPYKDKLVSLSNGSSPVICVDQNTGNIVWQQNFSAKEIDKFQLLNLVIPKCLKIICSQRNAITSWC
jgi:hypothetical protein